MATRLPPGVRIVNGVPVFSPFTPATSQPIPPTMYDPALDATLGQAKRGFNDLLLGSQTNAQRMLTDYGLQGEAITRGFDRSSADLGLQGSRGFEDLATQAQGTGRSFDRAAEDLGFQRSQLGVAQTREGQDYGTAVQGIERNYGRLANSQRQQESAYGVLRGGAALQAARKRAANQQIARQPLDTCHSRAGEDFATQFGQLDLAGRRLGEDRATAMAGIDTARSRLGQDLGTQGTRLGEDTALARGNLNLQYAPPDASNPMGGRAWQDMGTQLQIAGRELGATGIDTERAKAFQAAQMGYTGPPRPYNEQTNPLTGGATRTYTINGVEYTVGKGGKILSQKRVR